MLLRFEEVLPALRAGKAAFRKNWKKVYLGYNKDTDETLTKPAMYIWLCTDYSTNFLVLSLPDGKETPYTITNQDLLAGDWDTTILEAVAEKTP